MTGYDQRLLLIELAGEATAYQRCKPTESPVLRPQESIQHWHWPLSASKPVIKLSAPQPQRQAKASNENSLSHPISGRRDVSTRSNLLFPSPIRRLRLPNIPHRHAVKMSLRGKVALVTGGGNNLPAETARRLARQGCALALHYNTAKTRDQTLLFRDELRRAHVGLKVSIHYGDLASAAAVEQLFSDVVAEHRKVDLVV